MWKIEEFTVSEEAAKLGALRAAFSFSSRGRLVPAGTYHRLMRGGIVVMSDTPDELADLREFQRRATGRVLINGLGLGIATKMALHNPDVTHITVVEIEGDVIDLVAPLLYNNVTPHNRQRLEIHRCSAFDFCPLPGERWNVVWHDIWDDICADNLRDMTRLHRKYGRRCDWQGSWCRDLCQRAAKK